MSNGLLDERRARTSPARSSRRLGERRRTWSGRSPTTRSCGGCSTKSSAASSTRSRPYGRYCRRSSKSMKTKQLLRRRLTSRRRASASSGSPARPGLRLGSLLAHRGPRRPAEGREPAADRLFKVRGPSTALARCRRTSARRGWLRRVPGTTARPSRGRPRGRDLARIYVPQDASMAKVEACRYVRLRADHGRRILRGCAGGGQGRHRGDRATFVHPFEDPVVIAGQGTIELELAQQVPEAETVVIPVGGGGLASRIALALRASRRTSGSWASRPGWTGSRSPTASSSSSG